MSGPSWLGLQSQPPDGRPHRLPRGLLAAVTDLDVLPHAGPAGRVMLAAAVAGNGCSDDAVALAASMLAAAVREHD